MATLNWVGKQAVINHDKEVPFKLLKKVKSASVGTSQNLIVHGDNLEALKALMPHYQGKVKCIYIDPPYNTGNERWTYNDKVNSPKIRQWLGKVVGQESEDLNRHDKWLCMMYPRLKLLRDLLSEDGAIYVQLDYNEVHYCKALMDEIFGRENFQREIIWRIGWISGYKSADKNWVRNHDTILFYSKNSDELTFTKQYNTPKDYLERFNGEAIKQLAQYFKNIGLEKKKVSAAVDFAVKAGLPERYPLEDTWNANPYDKLNSIAIVSFAGEKVSKLLNTEEFKGQKSVELIKRIVRAHTSKDDIVLDSFAGTGTTGHAVLDLNKDDGQSRRFILVEMEDHARTLTAERIKKVIRKQEYEDGFEYCELDKPLFNEEGQIEETCAFDQFASYVYFTETQTNIDPAKVKGNYIGENGSAEYYLIYKEPHKNDLDKSFLKKLSKTDAKKIVYADRCTLDETDLAEYNLVFKQIPYEVKIY